MPLSENSVRKTFFMRFLPVIAFIGLFVVGLSYWQTWKRIESSRSEFAFNEYATQYTRNVSERVTLYKMLMQGGGGVFISSDEVQRNEWHEYYIYRRVAELFPGIEGLGYVLMVPDSLLEEHLSLLKGDVSTYEIWPKTEGGRNQYAPVVYLEPETSRSKRYLGYDMMFEDMRRNTIERARDTGETAMSSQITLVHEELQASFVGFLLFVPVYTESAPLPTVEERRQKIEGFIFSAIRMDRMMERLAQNNPASSISARIYDGEVVEPAALMYDSNPSHGVKEPVPLYTTTEQIQFYGNTWTIVFESLPSFGRAYSIVLSWGILLGSLLISLFAALFVRGQIHTRDLALKMADEMTEALNNHSSRLIALYNNAPDGIVIVNRRGIIQSANPSAERLLKYEEGMLEGMKVEELVPERFKGHTEFRLSYMDHPATRAMGDGRDLYARCRDGSELPVEILLSTIRSSGEELAVATIRDITVRKNAQLLLQKEQEEIKLILDSLGEGIIEIDHERQVTFANPEACRLLGFEREELIGQDKHDLIHHTKVDGTPAPRKTGPIHESLEKGVTARVNEDVFWKKDGTFLPVSFTTTPIFDVNKKIRGAVISFRDISERNRIEVERIARKSAEEASRTKSMFVANMSHEIRTPLNAIMGFTQILSRDASLSSKQIKQVQTIHRSGAHLLTLIDDILDMSKIEAGRITLRPIPFNLEDFVADIELMFHSRATAKGLRILVETEFGEITTVRGDEARLRQILVNLIGNAVKFTNEGGVAIRLKTVLNGERLDEGIWLIAEVEDSGPGITDEELDTIFNAFQQASAGTREGGTGLGLAISKRFIEMMGGSITVSSQEGKGSIFRFEVLLEAADAVERSESQAARRVIGIDGDASAFRILVVDDMPDNRLLLKELLTPLGFSLREAVNGAEALDIFADWSPHIILMDMRMPVMDGYEAVRTLRASEAGRNVHIIAVTASAFEDARKEVMATGVDAYLRKPFQSDDLFALFAEYLKINFIYEENLKPEDKAKSTVPAEKPDIQSLPGHLVDHMRLAVDEGDMIRFSELVNEVADHNQSWAEYLQALIDRYDYDRLNELLHSGGTSDG